MKKAYFVVILIVIVVVGFLIFEKKPANAPTEGSNQQISDEYANLPLERAKERILKKPFGIYVTPQNSPVQPERFSGYHTGTDFEIFAGEKDIDVKVFAICNGKLLEKRTVSGYGGALIQSCELDGQQATVFYGHIRLASIAKNIGEDILQGEQLAVLGEGYSSEINNERKHLHLGIHEGTAIDLRGYVQTQQELNDWINYEDQFND